MFRTVLVHHEEQLYKLYIAFRGGTALQAGRSRCSMPDGVIGIFH